MKKTALVLAVPLALAFVACDKMPTSPQQLSPRGPSLAVIVNEWSGTIPLSTTNTCNGDVVSGTGKIHIVVSQTTDANGGLHYNTQVQVTNIKLTGSPSGASYVGNETQMFSLNLLGLGGNETEATRFKLIGQGQTPNAIVDALFHVTVNANGDVTSSIDNFSFECH
jgi:hypothetical protein